MPVMLEERVDRLEYVFGEFLVSTNAILRRLERAQEESRREMKDFKDEMKDFKDEMKMFKDETEADRKRMNKQWGELANKMGTLVEDIVAPNISRIAEEYFHVDAIDFFAVRIKKRKAQDRSNQRDFDVIAVSEEYFIVNETKSTPRIGYIDDFIAVLKELDEYFPEYQTKTAIPVFSSLYIPENIEKYLSKHKVYALGMKDDTMTLLNFETLNGGSVTKSVDISH